MSLKSSMLAEEKIAILQDRSNMLALSRQFFMERGMTEVDCPLLSVNASVDAHIDLIQALFRQKDTCYLHSSPEYGMKRLLAGGMGDIFQLSHVFRDGESGSKHNPEFMMAEWYRLKVAFEDMIAETLDFIRLFLGPLPHEVISYREAFIKYAGFDYVKVDQPELIRLMKAKGIRAYNAIENEDKDSLLNLLLATMVEPKLGQSGLTALTYYPASQAALAETKMINDELVSERFEVYYKGMELCNGYHELKNPTEQRKRLHEANAVRKALGKNTLPIDENFLSALESGLPDCCGVAVGFDRLMMLRNKKKHISEVIPFDWNIA